MEFSVICFTAFRLLIMSYESRRRYLNSGKPRGKILGRRSNTARTEVLTAGGRRISAELAGQSAIPRADVNCVWFGRGWRGCVDGCFVLFAGSLGSRLRGNDG